MTIIPRTHVDVIPMVALADERYGGYKKVRGVPVRVDDVTVQDEPVDRRVRDTEGIEDIKVIRGKGEWPGGINSIVVFEGEEYDQIGKARIRKIGYYTKHFQVRIRARGAEVK